MAFCIAQTETISLKAVASIKLYWHPLPFLLEIPVKDIWVEHPAKDQRIDDFAFGFKRWINLLYRWYVVLNDVVTNQYVRIFKNLNPLFWVLVQNCVRAVRYCTAVDFSNVPSLESIRLHVERYHRERP